MIQSAEYTLDKVEEVWRTWRGSISPWRAKIAMEDIDAILSDSEKDILDDQGHEVI